MCGFQRLHYIAGWDEDVINQQLGGTPTANEKNLKPQNSRTKSEQRRIAVKGGKASGKSRRTRKLFRELLEDTLAQKLNDAEIIDSLVSHGFISNKDEIDIKTAITYMRLLRELDNPTPEGFEKLMKALGEDAGEDKNTTMHISIDVPDEYKN